MSYIETVVTSLEYRVSKVLHKLHVLEKTNLALRDKLAMSQQTITEQSNVIKAWEDKYETLKFANSILGSEESKKETKLKINTLIREIDYCIAQLSE